MLFESFGQYKFRYEDKVFHGIFINLPNGSIKIRLFDSSDRIMDPMEILEIRLTSNYIIVNDITLIIYISNIYICYADLFATRKIQTCCGISGVFYIERDISIDSEISWCFEGHQLGNRMASYINAEHAYLRFRILIVEVNIYF